MKSAQNTNMCTYKPLTYNLLNVIWTPFISQKETWNGLMITSAQVSEKKSLKSKNLQMSHKGPAQINLECYPEFQGKKARTYEKDLDCSWSRMRRSYARKGISAQFTRMPEVCKNSGPLPKVQTAKLPSRTPVGMRWIQTAPETTSGSIQIRIRVFCFLLYRVPILK